MTGRERLRADDATIDREFAMADEFSASLIHRMLPEAERLQHAGYTETGIGVSLDITCVYIDRANHDRFRKRHGRAGDAWYRQWRREAPK